MQAPPEQLRRHFGAESVRMIDLHDGTTRVEAGAPTVETLREWLSVPGVAREHLEGNVV